MDAPAWLIRPFAHRGLHDDASGVIENTASAVQAAIDAGYGIEVDVQPSADGEAMVFHDATLERLTMAEGPVAGQTAAQLRRVRFRDTADRMQTLGETLAQVSERAPLLIEIKSDWGARGPFEQHLANLLKPYPGPAAVMSFDPDAVAAFASAAPELARGLVACDFRDTRHWGHLTPAKRLAMRHLLSAFIARPHFVAYDVEALPAAAPWAWRRIVRRPLLTWAVRDDAQRQRAARWADAMIFEGFRP